jgi:hypothetical protein
VVEGRGQGSRQRRCRRKGRGNSGLQSNGQCFRSRGGAGTSCEHAGSVVITEATRGSTAVDSDTAGPVCMPKNRGIAKVISPMGNCRPM